ncbi:MAG: hypothetical protein HON98_10560 [Chloroflexi bacterium]|jgi:hypothetical protein|nr:hypothetical protein [Chloroflexota bacterium]MBT3670662.1 hypothetical protein [Chloroflexota bacterium]MBT4002679.1 hypothetical protein [Chloroflexota bacterium]MBT4306302.1 hypothetical protein [Chloroflexota bacterium]MBT4532817.1 hypothetical protein [Chloroflexota bacterium]
MTQLPELTDLILVAFLPHPKDLEIARLLGWYRIPLRSSPKVVAVDWLAFYQPATFGEGHKWCVEHIAPVLGHELTTRGELFKDQLDHPSANEEYFKIQLGPIITLPSPVKAGEWKRITFLYTTGEHLLKAEGINDLTVREEERKIMWRPLRERAKESQNYKVGDLPELPIDPEIIAMFTLMSGSIPTTYDED